MSTEEPISETPIRTFEEGIEFERQRRKERNDRIANIGTWIFIAVAITVLFTLTVVVPIHNWVTTQTARIGQLEVQTYRLCELLGVVVRDVDAAHDRIFSLYEAVPSAIEPSQRTITETTPPTTLGIPETNDTTPPQGEPSDNMPQVEPVTPTTMPVPPPSIRPTPVFNSITDECQQMTGREPYLTERFYGTDD